MKQFYITLMLALYCFCAKASILNQDISNKMHNLTWDGIDVLQFSTNLNDWIDIRNAENTHASPIIAPNQFYRLRQADYSLHSNYSNNNDVALIDYDKNLIHIWSNAYPLGTSAYLQDDGSIIKSGRLNDSPFIAGGVGGNIEKLSWDSSLIWNFTYSSSNFCLHHDIEVLPNGNILAIAWELLDQQSALNFGRDPALLSTNDNNVVWSESIIELEPDGTNAPSIVWRWNAHDHLIQDYDSTKLNYGIISENPNLINFNYPESDDPDWLHLNGIDYNADLDQIVLSSRTFSEIWIIDHSTTIEEAATSQGGNSGMGGNILYRYGNPQAYDRGTASDQKLGGQHNPTWIPKNYDGAGNLLIFNNGLHRGYSSVDEITPPLTNEYKYFIEDGQSFGPNDLEWTYDGNTTNTFYAAFVCGTQRLHNGNTLITIGPTRRYFEVTHDGDIVWDHIEPGNGIIFKVERYFFDIPN